MDNPIRIIIAEDLPILRQHFCELIENEPDFFLVGEASNGKDAVSLADNLGADVVLMDIEMEIKNDGIIAAKEIRSRHPEIRIVFLTIHEDDETVFEAFDAGAVDYILKTLPNNEIISGIRAAYRGNSAIRPEVASKIRQEFSRIRQNENQIIQVMNLVGQLTTSEREILRLLLQGLKISAIAKQRSVEETTIKSQINIILKKFNKKRTKEIIKLINELKIGYIF
ncbi:MAG TPA: DNA-binding response regulator [Firmicutes bacterium]|jgi:DNA-binding NarL/FixJ family response regulator|nr:DNA-binding response regulator [Bacillota bacterium]